jgi:hypothetical protein
MRFLFIKREAGKEKGRPSSCASGGLPQEGFKQSGEVFHIEVFEGRNDPVHDDAGLDIEASGTKIVICEVKQIPQILKILPPKDPISIAALEAIIRRVQVKEALRPVEARDKFPIIHVLHVDPRRPKVAHR